MLGSTLHHYTTLPPTCDRTECELHTPGGAWPRGKKSKTLEKKQEKHIETSRSSPGEPAGKERGVFRNNGLGDINIMVQLITIKIDKVGFSDRVIVVVATYMCTMLGKQDGNLMDSLTH